MTKTDQFLIVFLVMITIQTPLACMEVKAGDSNDAKAVTTGATAGDLKEELKTAALPTEDQALIDQYLEKAPECTSPELLYKLLYDLLHHDKIAQYREEGDFPSVVITTIADRLKAKKVDLNALMNETKETILHIAAAGGSGSIVKIAHRAGANVDARDEHNETPLHHAAYKGSDDERNAMVCGLLLGLKATMDAQNNNYDTPLHRAAEFGKAACFMMLVIHKASSGMLNKQGRTAMHLAAGNRDKMVCTFALTHGHQSSFFHDEEGKTAADCAPKMMAALEWAKTRQDVMSLLSSLFSYVLNLRGSSKPEDDTAKQESENAKA